jgi:hypothetical protein
MIVSFSVKILLDAFRYFGTVSVYLIYYQERIHYCKVCDHC